MTDHPTLGQILHTADGIREIAMQTESEDLTARLASANDELTKLRNQITGLNDNRTTWRSALAKLLEFRSHDDDCQVGQTDFCTCGMKQAADAARALLNGT